MKIINSSLLFILFIALMSCNSGSSNADSVEAVNGQHKAVIKEVQQTASYSYLLVEENSNSFWVACNRQEYSPNQTVYFMEGLPMENFESKELGRTFDIVYFLNEVSLEPIPLTQPESMAPHGMVQNPVKKDIQIEKVDGGITLSELFANPESFKGKTVKIKGEVVKYNEAIMGKNWVHIQDGTGKDKSFDLTVTTIDAVKVGDVVVCSGIINLNKDFGAGYTYDVIMEDAKLSKDI